MDYKITIKSKYLLIKIKNTNILTFLFLWNVWNNEMIELKTVLNSLIFHRLSPALQFASYLNRIWEHIYFIAFNTDEIRVKI